MSSPTTKSTTLQFPFRDTIIPVSFSSNIPKEHAEQALLSEPFQTWIRRCERTVQVDATTRHQLLIHSVELQSVDMFGARGVGFVKLKSHTTLTVLKKGTDDQYVVQPSENSKPLPGICFLRGSAVSILVALFCEDGQVYSLLVEQPRVPLGQVACLEVPAGMVDDTATSIVGIAVQEMQEECGIVVRDISELVDLTELALDKLAPNRLPGKGIPPSPGGCDEVVRYFYLEKKVTQEELARMKGRLQGLRDHGEYITLRVVPMDDVWKISGDAKAMISLFLVDQLRKEGKLPEPGCLATPLQEDSSTRSEPRVSLPHTNAAAKRDGSGNSEQPSKPASRQQEQDSISHSPPFSMPQLAFGLYQVPKDDTGIQIIKDAIDKGYRHFDSAEFYGNEAALGKALQESGIPRSEFFLTAKVWKTTVAAGPKAVKDSIQKSLNLLGLEGDDNCYVDLAMIHWPVAGHFVAAYQALQELHQQGLVRALGLSNFNQQEYEELMSSSLVTVPPVCNQMEVSPVMYRPELINFYQQKAGMVVVAFKPLQRGALLEQPLFAELAKKYNVSVAQLVLRWGIQHGFVVAAKTSSRERMKENRRVWHFCLSQADIALMDGLTKPEDIEARTERERVSKLV